MRELKIYPGFIHIATKKKLHAPLALWLLARSIDENGAGHITYDQLKGEALEFWSRSKLSRAMTDGEANGFLVHDRRHGRVFLTSIVKLCYRFDIGNVGKNAISIRASAIRKVSTFRAAIWAAFQDSRPCAQPDRPISRQILADLSSISRKTQAKYETIHNERRNGQIKAQSNLLILPYPKEMLNQCREMIHGACFCYYGKVARPLPNNYLSTMRRCMRGRTKKINRQLKALVKCGAGEHEFNRLFITDSEEFITRLDDETLKPEPVLYRAGRTYRGAGIYHSYML